LLVEHLSDARTVHFVRQAIGAQQQDIPGPKPLLKEVDLDLWHLSQGAGDQAPVGVVLGLLLGNEARGQ
jgi:hypothetical protein